MGRAEEIFERLPGAVAERVRVVAEREVPPDGRHVVYWMHHAVRAHENPALDAARVAAVELGLPLVVYQGLGGGHPYDNDRHHTFILEGAREVRAELAARGVSHVFWLGADRSRPSPLVALAREAALVVTEDFPAPPFPRWTAGLAAKIEAPLWAVDTACVVPMRLVDRVYDRAFRFRDAIEELLAERLERPWEEVGAAPEAFDRSRLGFDDADLESTPIPELVARCPIDHTVGPVIASRGGSAAGYARWRDFLEHGLDAYAKRRNDAADDGVSRMSPYLHHGHVSPLAIARQAAEAGGKGAKKFLDELIVWRELAHNLCFHRHRVIESLAVLPEWARETLAEHAGDPRELRSWETLARARSGEPLWDLCQASLLRRGELHNNLRMTWGKAIPFWAATPERALELLIDLNHRYALDGSDPNSYGGLLWCLGLFDRPFKPAKPVLGEVRGRSIAAHARRLDLERYAERVLVPASGEALDIAVVGAGVAGLIAARTLSDHGHQVRVFDKSRGTGGRMATRRAGELRFDHGAQYFTARDERFARFVDSWIEDGVAERWQGRIAELEAGKVRPKAGSTARYVGTPRMSSICRHLAAGLEPTLETRVGALEREGERWELYAEGGGPLGSFDAVVVALPAPQAAELLGDAAPALAARAEEAEIAPCWAAMVAFAEPLGAGFDGAFVHGSALSWAARNDSKPGRPGDEAAATAGDASAGETAECWVLHASPEWSQRHLERDRDEVARLLLDAFAEALGGLDAEPVHLAAHRWRYALPTAPLTDPCLFDPDLRLAVAGDWCGGPRVEGAFLSGAAAAGRLLGLRF